jgi:hypothetical protein
MLMPALPKPHREFFRIPPDAVWTPVHSTIGVVEELVLADSMDVASKTGSRSRLARWHAGSLADKAVIHDFCEEVLVVEGEFIVGCDASGAGGEAFGAYTFACRPPGVWHGPFASRTGCLLFEIQYYA